MSSVTQSSTVAIPQTQPRLALRDPHLTSGLLLLPKAELLNLGTTDILGQKILFCMGAVWYTVGISSTSTTRCQEHPL